MATTAAALGGKKNGGGLSVSIKTGLYRSLRRCALYFDHCGPAMNELALRRSTEFLPVNYSLQGKRGWPLAKILRSSFELPLDPEKEGGSESARLSQGFSALRFTSTDVLEMRLLSRWSEVSAEKGSDPLKCLALITAITEGHPPYQHQHQHQHRPSRDEPASGAAVSQQQQQQQYWPLCPSWVESSGLASFLGIVDSKERGFTTAVDCFRQAILSSCQHHASVDAAGGGGEKAANCGVERFDDPVGVTPQEFVKGLQKILSKEGVERTRATTGADEQQNEVGGTGKIKAGDQHGTGTPSGTGTGTSPLSMMNTIRIEPATAKRLRFATTTDWEQLLRKGENQRQTVHFTPAVTGFLVSAAARTVGLTARFVVPGNVVDREGGLRFLSINAEETIPKDKITTANQDDRCTSATVEQEGKADSVVIDLKTLSIVVKDQEGDSGNSSSDPEFGVRSATPTATPSIKKKGGAAGTVGVMPYPAALSSVVVEALEVLNRQADSEKQIRRGQLAKAARGGAFESSSAERQQTLVPMTGPWRLRMLKQLLLSLVESPRR